LNLDLNPSTLPPHPIAGRFSARLPVWVHAVPLESLLILVLALLQVISAWEGRPVWEDWPASSELHHPAYTEAVHLEEVVRTHANTWSNLAYVWVGLYGLAIGCHDLRHASAPGSGYLVRTPALSLLFGLACCFLGFGSGLFHASLTRLGQQLDVAAMYSPLLVFAHDVTRFTIHPESYGHRKDLPEAYEPGKTPGQPNHMVDFINCVRSRGTPKCPVDEAFIETATYLMSVESYHQKRLVRWDADREQIV